MVAGWVLSVLFAFFILGASAAPKLLAWRRQRVRSRRSDGRSAMLSKSGFWRSG